MSRVRLTWANASTTIVEQRVYRSTSPLDINNMPEPLAILPRRDRGYLDNTIEDGLAYYYAVSSVLPDYSELISKQIRVEATPVSDPHWDKVVALLHFDGGWENEAGVTWSPDTQAMFTDGKFGQGANFTGSRHQRIRAPISSDFEFGNEDFTIEFFTMSRSIPPANSWPSPLAKRHGYSDMAYSFSISQAFPSFAFEIVLADQSRFILRDPAPITPGEVYFLAVTRHGDVMRLFKDGVVVATASGIGTRALRSTSARVTLGVIGSNATKDNDAWNGYVDELRITKGVARYTENFTPPTEPFPNN